jgi:hypothetical protein
MCVDVPPQSLPGPGHALLKACSPLLLLFAVQVNNYKHQTPLAQVAGADVRTATALTMLKTMDTSHSATGCDTP